jgi:DNA-binding PadR family transcriptional regulator
METQKKKPWRRTGLSRSILLTLDGVEATIDEILEQLEKRPGPRASDKEITSGAVWVILERAMRNGLVVSNRREAKKPYLYRLTAGGIRRVKWIKAKLGLKSKPELRAVANPKPSEEE